jgi:uncharacterized protein involved in outer membrane biogenesis
LSEVRAEIPGMASVRAEQVDAHLRLLPLLHGRAEIASVSLSRPVIQVQISPPQATKEESPEEEQGDPVESYRSVVAAIRSFAPEAVLDVEEGEVEIAMPDLPPVRVRKLELHGRTDSKGMALELTAVSDAWSRLKLTASVDFGDGSGAAKAEIAGLESPGVAGPAARECPWASRFPTRACAPKGAPTGKPGSNAIST